MIYSKNLIDNVLTYLTAELEPMLVQIESQYSITVDRLKYFETVNKETNQYPFGMLYEDETVFDNDTLTREISRFNFSVDFADSRLNLTQVRNNLYAYRDAIVEIINNDPTLGNNCVQAYLTRVQPALIMKESANYNGVIQCQFVLEEN